MLGLFYFYFGCKSRTENSVLLGLALTNQWNFPYHLVMETRKVVFLKGEQTWILGPVKQSTRNADVNSMLIKFSLGTGLPENLPKLIALTCINKMSSGAEKFRQFSCCSFFLRITLERQKCFKIMLRKLLINAGVYVVNVILNLRVSDNGKTDHVSTIANNFSH